MFLRLRVNKVQTFRGTFFTLKCFHPPYIGPKFPSCPNMYYTVPL